VLELRKVDGLWQAWDGERLLASAPVVVLAGAAEVRASRLRRAAAQAHSRADHPLAGHRRSRALRTVVCAEGYVAPPRGDEHTLGASFDFHSEDHADHSRAPGQPGAAGRDFHRPGPALGRRRAGCRAAARPRAFRCTSPDYLPIVGPVADTEAFAEAYAALARDARQVPDIACPWLEGLYVNSGHGSRGLITAPLSGELIAAWVSGEPLPVPEPWPRPATRTGSRCAG
jgi:tRNA 5-methylaminomethyl-2-thiouridine biosynthesis bifunctional protein